MRKVVLAITDGRGADCMIGAAAAKSSAAVAKYVNAADGAHAWRPAASRRPNPNRPVVRRVDAGVTVAGPELGFADFSRSDSA
jgi:hypothetical protein